MKNPSKHLKKGAFKVRKSRNLCKSEGKGDGCTTFLR